jgi:hypothetical protein
MKTSLISSREKVDVDEGLGDDVSRLFFGNFIYPYSSSSFFFPDLLNVRVQAKRGWRQE